MTDKRGHVKGTKIIIMGMENAGKTTIVDFLTKETYFIPESAPMYKPTIGVSHSSLLLADKIISVWDFGGQEAYRNEYMKHPELYFTEVSTIYYVVDVQDQVKIISSTMYFKGIIQVLRTVSPNAKLKFLFHKSDPGFDTTKLSLKKRILDAVEPALKAFNLAYEIYDTSIFIPESILSAFEKEANR